MQHWFPSFTYGPVVTAFAVNGLFGLLAWLLVFKVRIPDELKQYPVQPTFVNVPGGIFSLSVAFMGAAAMQSAESAHVSLQQERMALERLHVMTAGADGLDEVRRHLREYVSAVQTEEWGTDYNTRPSARVDATIHALTAIALRGGAWPSGGTHNIESQRPAPPRNEFIRYVDQLTISRAKRLELGSRAVYGYIHRWVIIWLTSFLVCVSTLSIHANRPHSALFSLVVFCLSSALAMSTVALHLHPYKGPRALKASALAVDLDAR